MACFSMPRKGAQPPIPPELSTKEQMRLLMRPPPPPETKGFHGLGRFFGQLTSKQAAGKASPFAGPSSSSDASIRQKSGAEAGPPAWVQQRILLCAPSCTFSHFAILRLKEKLHESALQERLADMADDGDCEVPTAESWAQEWGRRQEPAWQWEFGTMGPNEIKRLKWELLQ